MGFHLVESRTVRLTPELASEFMNLEPSPTERRLDPERVKHLRAKAESGKLVTFQWSRALIGNRIMRMNGQHSSTMLCGLNGAFPEGLQAHIDDYAVDDSESLADLFRQFDDRKSSRTPADVSGAYQGLCEDLFELDRTVGKLGIDAYAWWRREIEELPVPSGDDVYGLFENQAIHEYLLWLGSVFNIKTPELRVPGVVAAMYATFIANEQAAREFWHSVARGGVEYQEDAPATILDGWLKDAKEEKDPKKRTKPAAYYQGCIYAWNAFRKDQALKAIRVDLKKGTLEALV